MTTRKCQMCGKPSDKDVHLILAAHIKSWVTRNWILCEDCMWKVENAAGEFIGKMIMEASKNE